MIVVTVIVESTADDIAALQAAIKAMEEHSRAETGCLDYTFSVELNDPDIMRITECWESEEALAAHMQTAHMTEFRKAIAANPPKNMQASFYNAKAIAPPRG